MVLEFVRAQTASPASPPVAPPGCSAKCQPSYFRKVGPTVTWILTFAIHKAGPGHPAHRAAVGRKEKSAATWYTVAAT